jgi:hypothetical protein
MYATTDSLTWLWPVKFAIEALEGTVASEAGIPDLPHIPMGRGLTEYHPEM